METEHYNALEGAYDSFVKWLLRRGQLPARNTVVGYWGITPLRETRELFDRLNIGSHASLLDLGSGDGRVVLLASLYGVRAHGIEFDPALLNTAIHIKSRLNLPVFSRAGFSEGNYMDHDFSGYGVVYISPDKPLHRQGLERKLSRELKGSLIVHGWEFFPRSLRVKEQHVINGEKYIVYVR